MTNGPEGDSVSPGRSEQGLIAERKRKLETLRAQGMECFPGSYPGVQPIASVRVAHEDLKDGQETDSAYRVAGRIVGRRGHGKAAFLDLLDRSGMLQLHARADVLGADGFGRLVGLDLGDLIGADGTAFKTRRGELSLKVTDWQLLAKSLRPPPEKFHGLEDVETRYRQRELDLIANEEVRELFLLRTRIVSAVRSYLDERGFVEVETPVLQPLYGGALARPFVTHHNALGRDFYLRIATELYLKRLVVGGLEKVYELGKDFRNEGISHKHNPEFTMLETYEAYVDYRHVAQMVEELVGFVAQAALGTTVVSHEGKRIELAPPWRRVALREAIAERTGIDFLEFGDRDGLVTAMKRQGYHVPERAGYGKLVDELLSKHVEPELHEPTIVMDYPIELSPFARSKPDDPRLVERFEAFAGGVEIANAFSELNDPEDQRKRFEQQRDLLAEGDEEAQPYDEAFLAALEHGMPPTGGSGIGIDRLVALLADRHSIREVILFPALRDPGDSLGAKPS